MEVCSFRGCALDKVRLAATEKSGYNVALDSEVLTVTCRAGSLVVAALLVLLLNLRRSFVIQGRAGAEFLLVRNVVHVIRQCLLAACRSCDLQWFKNVLPGYGLWGVGV